MRSKEILPAIVHDAPAVERGQQQQMQEKMFGVSFEKNFCHSHGQIYTSGIRSPKKSASRFRNGCVMAIYSHYCGEWALLVSTNQRQPRETDPKNHTGV